MLQNLTIPRILLYGFGFVLLYGMLGGCETVKGVGRDITNASETVQRALP